MYLRIGDIKIFLLGGLELDAKGHHQWPTCDVWLGELVPLEPPTKLYHPLDGMRQLIPFDPLVYFGMQRTSWLDRPNRSDLLLWNFGKSSLSKCDWIAPFLQPPFPSEPSDLSPFEMDDMTWSFFAIKAVRIFCSYSMQLLHIGFQLIDFVVNHLRTCSLLQPELCSDINWYKSQG